MTTSKCVQWKGDGDEGAEVMVMDDGEGERW
jgi:hypothetical protein